MLSQHAKKNVARVYYDYFLPAWRRVAAYQNVLFLALVALTVSQPAFAVRYPDETKNLLVDAKLTSNIESFAKGLRGTINQIIYDLENEKFVAPSLHHEYGVGFMQNLGVVPEAKPIWWMAEWHEPVEINTLVLSGAYPNQPQPNTAWEIEVRKEGQWTTIERGIGGWYYSGQFEWGGPGTPHMAIDALRVKIFSKDKESSISSIHFRGKEGTSWVVANLPPVDASLKPLSWPVRAAEKTKFAAVEQAGDIRSWEWDFGDGTTASGRTVDHAFSKSGVYNVKLRISDGTSDAIFTRKVTVESSLVARIKPLEHVVLTGEAVVFEGMASGKLNKNYEWDFGDGETAHGESSSHVFDSPGIYEVKLNVSDGMDNDTCLALVRVHTEETVGTPQLLLDTDAKNEVDDQHYISYGLFSDLDILGINSIHHGGGQEPTNYGEILNIIDLASQSGLPEHRKPLVFRGANKRLVVPESRKWQDTIPEVTPASEAILAAARGAAPGNPVLVLPVGPCTNVASAMLQARAEGLDLTGRLRVIGLVGGPKSASVGTFNGANDPWSVYVVAKSGIEFWALLESPTGASLRFDKRKEGNLYPKNPLGDYLKKITPAHNKSLFDVATISMVIGEQRHMDWLTEVEFSKLLGPEQNYFWDPTTEPTNLRVIRDIDEEAMKDDFFETINN